MIPDSYQLRYSGDQIASRVLELAQEITPWAEQVYERDGKDLVTIPVLRGGVFFFTDLVRSVKHSVEVVPVRAVGYDEHSNELKQKVEVRFDDMSLSGRSVLLIDDVCDSGKTLHRLKGVFLEAGAYEVRSVVMLKRLMQEHTFDPDWIGFQYSGNEWFVGYGMDDGSRWRNLPEIYTIENSGRSG